MTRDLSLRSSRRSSDCLLRSVHDCKTWYCFMRSGREENVPIRPDLLRTVDPSLSPTEARDISPQSGTRGVRTGRHRPQAIGTSIRPGVLFPGWQWRMPVLQSSSLQMDLKREIPWKYTKGKGFMRNGKWQMVCRGYSGKNRQAERYQQTTNPHPEVDMAPLIVHASLRTPDDSAVR